MAKITYLVRLLERSDDGPDGPINDLGQNYSMNELGNTIPAPGDHIVSPEVLIGHDSLDPTNRTIYEVKERYFMPTYIDENKDKTVYIGLVVRQREGLETEREVCHQ